MDTLVLAGQYPHRTSGMENCKIIHLCCLNIKSVVLCSGSERLQTPLFKILSLLTPPSPVALLKSSIALEVAADEKGLQCWSSAELLFCLLEFDEEEQSQDIPAHY